MKRKNSNCIEVNPSPSDYTIPIKAINDNYLKNSIKHGLFSRIMIYILFFSYIFCKINFNHQYIFANIPLFTITKLEIHRIITNIFVCESFYELIIGIIMISTIINNFENKEGTILFFFKFFYNLIISQIFLLFIYFIISRFYPIAFIYRINSREFLCIAYLVKHLLTTETKKISNPYFGKLNDRFIIVVFILMYFFLNYEYRIENLLCLYYGFIICKYKKIFDLQFLSQKYIYLIESNEMGKILKISEYFVPFHSAENNISNNTLNNSGINNNKYLKKNEIYKNEETIGLKANDIYEDMDI